MALLKKRGTRCKIGKIWSNLASVIIIDMYEFLKIFLTVYNLYFLITLNNIENKLMQLDDYNFRKNIYFLFLLPG